jgi:hypothetical protein
MRWVDENSHELGDCPPTRTPWIVIAWRALLAILVLALSIGGGVLALGRLG